jgi:hypothetical protein
MFRCRLSNNSVSDSKGLLTVKNSSPEVQKRSKSSLHKAILDTMTTVCATSDVDFRPVTRFLKDEQVRRPAPRGIRW